MSFGAIIGQILEQGVASRAGARMRNGAAASGGAGMEQVLAAMLGAAAGRRGAAAPGGLEGLLGGTGADAGSRPTGGIDPMGSLRPGARGAPSSSQGGIADIIGQALGGATQRPGAGPDSGSAPGGSGGLADMLGGLLGGAPGGRSGSGGGALSDLLGAALGGARPSGGQGAGAQGMVGQGSGGQAAGGLADMLGALLGGGRRAGSGGSAMALLGGLALSALRDLPARSDAAVAPEEAEAVVSDDAQALVLAAMIQAMKADGVLDAAERAKLESHLGRDGVTQEEAAFVEAELARPIDVGRLAAMAREPALAAQAYAASVVAIEIDTEAERAYLRDLAQTLGLDAGTVARLHAMTGAPVV